MRITDARPAPRTVCIPTPVLEVALELGKGQLNTLVRIARYLWGRQPLEGSSAEFCTVLGIDERTWQRHIAEIGIHGCLRYTQPGFGLYVLLGFPRDAEQVQALRAAWQRVEQESARLRRWELPLCAESFFVSAIPPKVAEPVIVLSPGFEDLSQSDSGIPDAQQHALGFPGGCGGAAAPSKLAELPASKLAQLDPDEQGAYDLLVGEGVTAETARELAHVYWPERIEDVVDEARARRVNPGWIVAALRREWELAGDRELDAGRYVAGEWAALIQH